MSLTSSELRKVIVLARRTRNLTQAALAHKAGIARSTYALFEKGHIDLNASQIAAIENVIDAATPKTKPAATRLAARVARVRGSDRKSDAIEQRKSRREIFGLSQFELAREAGLSQTKISAWETGRRELTPDEHAQWSAALSRAANKKWGPSIGALLLGGAEPKTSVSELLLGGAAVRIKAKAEKLLAEQNRSLDDPIVVEIIASLRRELDDLEEKLRAKGEGA